MHTKSNKKNTVKVFVSGPPWPYSARKQQTGQKCKCSKPTTTKYKFYGKCGGRVGLVGPLMHKKRNNINNYNNYNKCTQTATTRTKFYCGGRVGPRWSSSAQNKKQHQQLQQMHTKNNNKKKVCVAAE